MKTKNAFRNFRLFVLAFLVLFAVLASPPSHSGAMPTGVLQQEQPEQPEPEEDEVVPQVPLYGDGWIEFAPAPVYETKNQLVTTTTKLDKVEAFACVVFKFRPDGNIESWPGRQPQGAYRVVTDIEMPYGIPGGAQLQCKEFRKMILEVELYDSIVSRKGKKLYLECVSLRLKNYDAEKWTDCVVEGHAVRTNSKSYDGSKAEWWTNNLRDWPMENGHSEVVGRFQYTLHLVERKK